MLTAIPKGGTAGKRAGTKVSAFAPGVEIVTPLPKSRGLPFPGHRREGILSLAFDKRTDSVKSFPCPDPFERIHLVSKVPWPRAPLVLPRANC